MFYAFSCLVQAWLVYRISKSGFFAGFVFLLSFGFGGLKVLFMVLGISYNHPSLGDLQYLISLIVQFFSLPFIPVLLLFINRYLTTVKLETSS